MSAYSNSSPVYRGNTRHVGTNSRIPGIRIDAVNMLPLRASWASRQIGIPIFIFTTLHIYNHYSREPSLSDVFVADLEKLESEVAKFRAAAAEWIGDFWEWWRDGGDGVLENTCSRFNLDSRVLESRWEEHVRVMRRLGVDRSAADEGEMKKHHQWLADSVVLRLLALVWSIPRFKQVTHRGAFMGRGRME